MSLYLYCTYRWWWMFFGNW